MKLDDDPIGLERDYRDEPLVWEFTALAVCLVFVFVVA